MCWTTSVVCEVVANTQGAFGWKVREFLTDVEQVLFTTMHTFRLVIAVGSCMTKILATKILDSLFVYSRLFDFDFSEELGFNIKNYFIIKCGFQIDKKEGEMRFGTVLDNFFILFWSVTK
jgi:hypothetical protein